MLEKFITYCNKFVIEAIKMYSRFIEKEEADFRRDQKHFTEKVTKKACKLVKVKALARRLIECAWRQITKHLPKCLKAVSYLYIKIISV